MTQPSEPLTVVLGATSAVLGIPGETLFVIGVALMLMGIYLRWRLADHWMNAEERAKDGMLSEEQARRRIALLRYGGPLLILLGLIAFALVLWE